MHLHVKKRILDNDWSLLLQVMCSVYIPAYGVHFLGWEYANKYFEICVLGNSVVTDVQFGHLFFVYIKYDALQEVTCGLFRKISHCS